MSAWSVRAAIAEYDEYIRITFGIHSDT